MKNIKITILSIVILISSYVYSADKTVYGGGANFYGKSKKISGAAQSTLPAHSQFGWATSMHGEFTAISAPMEPSDSVEVGAVYVYRKIPGDWSFFQKIEPENPVMLHRFGASIKLNDKTLLIGVPGYNAKSGAVIVYEFDGSKWNKTQTIIPKEPIRFQKFGSALEVKDDLALINSVSSNEEGNASGIVYIFRNTVDGWIQLELIVSPCVNKDDLFGASFRIVNETHLIVAAPRGNSSVEEAGLVYSFIKSNEGWTVNQIIAPENGRTHGLFGASIDYSAGRLIVGEMEAKVDSLFSGGASLYELDASQKWDHTYRLVPESPVHHDYFGATVAIDQDYLIIGSPKWDKGIEDSDHGTAYIFSRVDSTWGQVGQITPEDLDKNDHFGMAMSLDGTNLVVGCSLDDSPHFNNGSSYFYDINTLTSVLVDNSIPLSFEIFQNYPNPFNPVTTIKYNLPMQTHVNISVYDILGRKVIELVNIKQMAGRKEINWNGINSDGNFVSSGTYIYRIKTDEYIMSKKMLLLK